MQEANVRHFSKEEEEYITSQAMMLIEQGRDAEADTLLYCLPMPAEYLQTLKEYMGIENLINEGINLSKAVEKYGQSWLTA